MSEDIKLRINMRFANIAIAPVGGSTVHELGCMFWGCVQATGSALGSALELGVSNYPHVEESNSNCQPSSTLNFFFDITAFVLVAFFDQQEPPSADVSHSTDLRSIVERAQIDPFSMSSASRHQQASDQYTLGQYRSRTHRKTLPVLRPRNDRFCHPFLPCFYGDCVRDYTQPRR
jgi:hypothetical protein